MCSHLQQSLQKQSILYSSVKKYMSITNIFSWGSRLLIPLSWPNASLDNYILNDLNSFPLYFQLDELNEVENDLQQLRLLSEHNFQVEGSQCIFPTTRWVQLWVMSALTGTAEGERCDRWVCGGKLFSAGKLWWVKVPQLLINQERCLRKSFKKENFSAVLTRH